MPPKAVLYRQSRGQIAASAVSCAPPPPRKQTNGTEGNPRHSLPIVFKTDCPLSFFSGGECLAAFLTYAPPPQHTHIFSIHHPDSKSNFLSRSRIINKCARKSLLSLSLPYPCILYIAAASLIEATCPSTTSAAARSTSWKWGVKAVCFRREREREEGRERERERERRRGEKRWICVCVQSPPPPTAAIYFYGPHVHLFHISPLSSSSTSRLDFCGNATRLCCVCVEGKRKQRGREREFRESRLDHTEKFLP